jgi:hypothetical protein
MLLLAACALSPLPAQAKAPKVTLHASFSPERPGQTTTVDFSVHVLAGSRLAPPPLTSAVVRYPAGLDIPLSGLGIDTCTTQTLKDTGPDGCRADSFIGDGTAVAELQVGEEVVREHAEIEIVRAPELQQGQLAMLFYVNAQTPVNAQIIFAGDLLPAGSPFGGALAIDVPLVEGLPEAPDVAVGQIQLTLGPQNLTYYEYEHGEFTPYKPRGIQLPNWCPRGGFRFAAELTFADGSHANSATSVPCWSHDRRRGNSQ